MKRILLVDDEPVNLDLIKEILRDEDALIATASSGKEAIAFANQNEIDLVISDLVMPGIRGTDLFFELRKIHPFLQVVIITAYPSFDDIVDMLEGGATDFLIKPIQAEHLLMVIHQIFAKIERWRKLRKELIVKRHRSQ